MNLCQIKGAVVTVLMLVVVSVHSDAFPTATTTALPNSETEFMEEVTTTADNAETTESIPNARRDLAMEDSVADNESENGHTFPTTTETEEFPSRSNLQQGDKDKDNKLVFDLDGTTTVVVVDDVMMTTDVPVVIETTVASNPDPEQESESVTELQESSQSQLTVLQVSKAEILNELSTIWNYTASMQDDDHQEEEEEGGSEGSSDGGIISNSMEKSSLKRRLTSLVRFTYDQVENIEAGETLGRLRYLLRELRHKLLIPEDGATERQQQLQHRRKRNSNTHVHLAADSQPKKVKKGLSLSLSDEIEAIENFLTSSSESLSQFSLTNDVKVDYESESEAAVTATEKSVVVVPLDRVIQKVIQVKDEQEQGFPTDSPQTTTTTMGIPDPAPVLLASSGLVQQSSITVKNVTGAIISLNAEQIANAIINLLYSYNYYNVTDVEADADWYWFPPRPPPHTHVQDEDTHDHDQVNNNDVDQDNTIGNHNNDNQSDSVQYEQEQTSVDSDGGTFTTETKVTVTSTTPKTPVVVVTTEAHTNWTPNSSTTASSSVAVAQILTTVNATPSIPTTQIASSPSLTLQDAINRIILRPSANSSDSHQFLLPPRPRPTTTALDQFGIAGPGNRRTTTTATTSTPRPQKFEPGVNGPNDYLSEENSDDDQESVAVTTTGLISNLMQNLTTANLMQAPLVLVNGTKEGLNEVISTFNVLNFQAKMTLIFALSISTLSIILGVFSLGPPIIIVGLLGIIIPMALLLLLTRHDTAGKRRKDGSAAAVGNLSMAAQHGVAGLTLDHIFTKPPITMQDINFILGLISDAVNKYKL